MTIAITSIQRDRNPWIVEWIAFHLLMGFDSFHIYAHRCSDGMDDTLLRLARHYPIEVYSIDSNFYPQQMSYQQSWNANKDKVDWMAFIDGDEFLFPTQDDDIAQALARYADKELSALAVYWMIYGSSGHVNEPSGLIVENFRRHASVDFHANRHVKTIMRGRRSAATTRCHVFETELGTFDEKMRPIADGLTEYEPSYEFFRINHYMNQSYAFFKNVKQNMGAADNEVHLVRPDSSFAEFDRNERDDGLMRQFLIPLKLKVAELQEALG